MSDQHFYSLDGPLDSLPAGDQVRAAELGGLGTLLRRHGASVQELLVPQGLDLRLLREPEACVPARQVAALLEDCSRRCDDALFGLHLAQLQDPDLFGIVTALCRSAASVRDAVQGFVDFAPVVHCPALGFELCEAGDSAELRWRSAGDAAGTGQWQYKSALLLVKLLRQLGGPGFRPRSVELAVDARAADFAEIADRFGCRFRGHADTCRIAFAADVLDQPVASANRPLFRLLGGYLERVRAVSRRSLVERVEDYVRGALPSGTCSIELCARQLGSSVRTLQAGLSTHCLRFSDIVERQRLALAMRCLEQDGMTLDDVAARLGYSEPSSFGRAFKRWTGSSPQGYRRQLDLRKAA